MPGTAILCTLQTAVPSAGAELGGLAAQAIGAAALGLVFAALAWQPMAVRGARAWAAAHALFACAALALVLRLALWPAAPPFSWEYEQTPAVRTLYAVHVAARVAGLCFLFAGVRAYARAPISSRVLALGVAVAALLGSAGAWLASDLSGAIALQAPLCALGFAACAVALARDSKPAALACAALAALWATTAYALGPLGSGASASLGSGASASLGSNAGATLGSKASATLDGALPLVVAYVPHADLALCLCAALGLVALLRRQQLVDANERAAKLAALEERLAQAKRMEAVGVLVSGVAHELSSPLSVILGHTEQAPGHAPLAAPTVALRVVHEQAQRCKAIVGDILTFVGSREERWEDLELRALAERVLEALRVETTARGIAIELLPGQPVTMRADAIGLEQVLTNLVQNATHATGAGGHVRVSVRADGDEAELCVEDDGPGVPPEVVDRIFEPFFTTKAVDGGSGLGLSISHGIMRTHGGSLRTENLPAPAHGARFIARLPLSSEGPLALTPWPRVAPRAGPPSWLHARPPTQHGTRPKLTPPEPLPVREVVPQLPAPARATPATPASASGARRICVIEDDAGVLSLLRAVFERERWEVQSFDDPRAALALLRSGARFDAIVSDVQMPHLSGPELFEIVARELPELLARLVFVTGDPWRPELDALRASGVCAILPKPLDLRALVDACNQRCAA